MKCPKCGLVHPPSQQVCRRCEIDLKTGEPKPRSALELQAPGGSALEKARERARAVKLPARKAAAPAAHKTAVPAPEARPDKHTLQRPGAGKKRKGLGARVAGLLNRQKGPGTIYCVQCSSPMAVNREAPFSKTGPRALVALAVALLVGGIFFHLLWITAALSGGLAVFYLRLGRTFWKCNSCGFIIQRSG